MNSAFVIYFDCENGFLKTHTSLQLHYHQEQTDPQPISHAEGTKHSLSKSFIGNLFLVSFHITGSLQHIVSALTASVTVLFYPCSSLF